MKRKIGVILGVFAVLIIGCVIWYMAPKYFLRGIAASEISCIKVFDGNTGEGFTVQEPEQIVYIVENIQSVEMKKSKLSIGYSGYRFKVSFLDEKGRELETFILNGENAIRKDPFFYTAVDGVLCYEYLEQLEAEAEQHSFRATVLELHNGYMLVEPVAGSDELRSSDQIAVGLAEMSVSPEPQEGDIVLVVYDGAILETYPAQLGKVYSVTVERENGE